jgi:hypothetical protein
LSNASAKLTLKFIEIAGLCVASRARQVISVYSVPGPTLAPDHASWDSTEFNV